MFGFFKKKRERNSLDEIADFVADAGRIIRQPHEFSLVVIGNDSGGNHIQCWFRPVLLGGRNYLCTPTEMVEWAKRASIKTADINYLKISICGDDRDGDFRSFEHRIVGDPNARQCLSSIMGLDVTTREAASILEITL